MAKYVAPETRRHHAVRWILGQYLPGVAASEQ